MRQTEPATPCSGGRRRGESFAGAWLVAVLMVLAFVAVAIPGAAQAQQAAPSSVPDKTAAQKLDSKELQGLIATLKDDEARGKFVQQLEALLSARRAVQGPAEATADRSWLSFLSDYLKDTVGQLFAVGAAFSDLPNMANQILDGARDPEIRMRWFEGLLKIVAILMAGYVAQLVTAVLSAKPRRAITARPHSAVWRRASLALLYAVLDLLPLAAFVAAALAVAPLTNPEKAIRLAALALINARLTAGVVMVVARLFLAPQAENLRTLPLTGETAQYLYIWVGRITCLALYGYFILEAFLLLGLSPPIHRFLLDVLGFAVAVLMIILILQNRDAVSQHIRTPPEEKSPFAVIRRPLAAAWHMLAIFYIVVLYVVLALRGNDGTRYIVQGTILTAVIVAAASLFENAVRRGVHHGLTIRDELRSRFPGLQMRLNRYTLALDYALRAFIYFVAAVAILQAWGFDALTWIFSGTGETVFSALANILVISVLAILVWEITSSFIERRLSVSAGAGAPTTRARTLLPLAQTTLKIVLMVLVAMVVLSEVGVNITPLLAGAGVVGVAVGFGSQKLVQDVITGWFILMEDTIAVGDVAEVAGHAGLVERINIRTIRLRDLSGVVHTVPFSAVTSVKNFTKDFSYYLFDVGVAYREDTDEVVEVLREIDAGMREDEAFKADILAPLEIIGVDRFEDSAVIVRARTMTRPLRQWAVGREFNRRMKKAFDERGIEIPFPHQTIYFGVAKDNTAPPAHIQLEQSLSEAFAGRKPEVEKAVEAKADGEKPDGEAGAAGQAPPEKRPQAGSASSKA
jgi:moderate conductance mechanosensitive channel